MTDWATISSLATAGGTLVLAVATFASVRSSNRTARLAELSLQEFGLTPVGDDGWLTAVVRHWYLDQDGPR